MGSNFETNLDSCDFRYQKMLLQQVDQLLYQQTTKLAAEIDEALQSCNPPPPSPVSSRSIR